jgi:hypothetical protein
VYGFYTGLLKGVVKSGAKETKGRQSKFHPPPLCSWWRVFKPGTGKITSLRIGVNQI